MKREDSSGAQSVDRALGLLSLVASSASGEISMTEITRQTGLSRPTARRLMLALIRAGLIEQTSEGGYELGLESLVVGMMATRRHSLIDAAMDSLVALAEETGDVCFLSARRNYHSVCLHRQEGTFPIRTHVLQAGARHPLGIGAGSMAILTALPDEQVEEILRATRAEVVSQYPDFTETFLHTELAEARARGWAVNPGKFLANSWAVGVPILGPGGLPMGSLSISAIDSRLTPDRQADLAKSLHREARRVEARVRTRSQGATTRAASLPVK